jgi:hypothetical protein
MLVSGLILTATATVVYLVVLEGYEKGIKAGASALEGTKFQTHRISNIPDILDFISDYRFWFAGLFVWTLFALKSLLTWLHSQRSILMLMFVTSALSVICDFLLLVQEAIDYFSIETFLIENQIIPITLQVLSYLLQICFSCLYLKCGSGQFSIKLLEVHSKGQAK